MPLDIGAQAAAEVVVGVGAVGEETAADLQDLVGADEVRQVELEVELLLDVVEATREDQRVGAAQAVVEHVTSVDAGALGRRIAGAELERAWLAVVDPDQDHAARAGRRGRAQGSP